MSIVATNPTRVAAGAQRARVATDAVVSAYIRAIANAARPYERSARAVAGDRPLDLERDHECSPTGRWRRPPCGRQRSLTAAIALV
jgi:hypothetical protein